MLSPLTGTDNVSLVTISDPRKIATLWRDGMKIQVGSDFEKIPKIELWKCHDTGLCWYEPSEAAGVGELYSQLENFEWYYIPDKWEFEFARKLVTHSVTALEVGVGFGHFLETCRTNGADIMGLELNPSAASRVRERGFKIFEEGLDQLADRIGEERFDSIFSFQVLEHVAAPRQFLEGMLRNLKVGGRIVISVPNASIMRRIDPDNRDILNQPPHHMSHWDVNVFKSLENYMPVKLRSAHQEPLAAYHVNWVVKSYLRNRFAFLGSSLNKILFNRVSLFPVHELMRLGFRKWFPGHTLLVELEKV